MLDDREILKLTIDKGKGITEWFDENQLLILSETVSASEYMVLNNLTECKVIDIYINSTSPLNYPFLMEVKVNMEDLVINIDNILDRSVSVEEYELAHRIKLLKEYLNLK